jgi:hypothetical protein
MGIAMSDMLFPEVALELLRQARYDPNAEPHCEIFSGGLA